MRREPFELRNDREQLIRGEVLHPPAPRGSVVICHGFKGYYRWGFFPWLAEHLAGAGLRTIAFNFSGSGVGEDRETFTEEDAFFDSTFERDLADLSIVVDQGRRREWIEGDHGLIGHSRGGATATLHEARRGGVSALVTWNSIARVMRWTADARREWREQGWLAVPNARTGQELRLGVTALDEVEQRGDLELSVPNAAARGHAPWLIVHGSADETVAVSDAHELAAAAARGERPHQLEIIDGAGHTLDVSHGMTEPSHSLARAASLTTDWLLRHTR